MREKFKWNVKLQADTGEVIDFPVEAFWAPDRDDTALAIGLTARAEAYMRYGKKKEFAPIKVERA